MFTKRKQRRMNMTHNEVRENLFKELWQLEFNLVYDMNGKEHALKCADTLCSDFKDAPNSELQKLIDDYNKEN